MFNSCQFFSSIFIFTCQHGPIADILALSDLLFLLRKLSDHVLKSTFPSLAERTLSAGSVLTRTGAPSTLSSLFVAAQSMEHGSVTHWTMLHDSYGHWKSSSAELLTPLLMLSPHRDSFNSSFTNKWPLWFGLQTRLALSSGDKSPEWKGAANPPIFPTIYFDYSSPHTTTLSCHPLTQGHTLPSLIRIQPNLSWEKGETEAEQHLCDQKHKTHKQEDGIWKLSAKLQMLLTFQHYLKEGRNQEMVKWKPSLCFLSSLFLKQGLVT